MIQNYLKVAFRYLIRQYRYSLLNLFGLSIGLLSACLILLYVYQELNYDSYHPDGDRVYRISSDITEPDNAFRWAVTQFPLGKTLKTEFAEVEQYSRFIPFGRTRFEWEEMNYFEEKVFGVDSTFSEIMGFEFIMGNPQKALDAPNSIVLNESLARRIFKKDNPMGKVLRSDDSTYFEVTGVYKDMPENSHLIAHALVSASSIPGIVQNNNWGGFSIYTYIKLNENTRPSEFQKKLKVINKKYVASIFDEFDIKVKYELLPIKDIHLRSNFEGEPEALGNIQYIYIFVLVGFSILFIATINYMNLATARSTMRSLEVGVRKTMGAGRGLLIGQFLAESIILSLASFILSIGLVFALVPVLNPLLGLSLDLHNLLHLEVIGIFLGVVILTGILAGSYPAFYLSSFQAVKVLKGSLSSRSGNKRLRRFLVGTQFAISMGMLVSTLVIYNQMQYVQNKDLGFDKQQVVRLVLNNPDLRAKWPVLKNKLLQNPNISRLSTASTSPGRGFSKQLMQIETDKGTWKEKGIDFYRVDYDFFPTLKIDFLEGRNFSQEFGSDSSQAILVNQAMVKRMNWKEAIGKKIRFQTNDTIPPMRVVGVVKDFHQQSLYNPIEALVFMPFKNNSNALIKIDHNLQSTLEYMESTWKALFPAIPFEYTFLDVSFMEQYESDQLRGNLFLAFSFIMILISCLGLFGLASFTAEQRSKEISIRRILGASTSGLLTLLVKEFVFLVLFAAIPAFILSTYFMRQWLENFEYHTYIGFGSLLLVFLLTLLITILTTSFHALKVVKSNPVDHLKYE